MIDRVLFAVALAAGGAVLPAAAAERPNILFIFTDDHAQAAISAYGSQVNATPHLDRLAAGGARFTNSFVTNSICTPSRATLLTGQYSHTNGVPVFNRFDGGVDHVAKRLRAAGYHTGMIGKWHLVSCRHPRRAATVIFPFRSPGARRPATDRETFGPPRP